MWFKQAKYGIVHVALTPQISDALLTPTQNTLIHTAESSYEKVDTRWLGALGFEFHR